MGTTFMWGALIVVLLVALSYSFNNDESATNSEDSSSRVSTSSSPIVRTTSTLPTLPVVSSGTTLDLSAKGYTKVPENTFTQTEIEKLDLSGNELTGSLPGEIRFMQSLISLDLSDNNFTGVPAEIGQLMKLTYLDLSNNPITGLPNELGKLTNLEVLDLHGTQYSKQDLSGIRNGLDTSIQILVDSE